ncbi:nucleotidyltransferase domain-containing protein [Candidatus Woesearchaeota archaeon]|nr:nucleotidyltransferase domain-containing protein [Candidatus Woesearchaeota archaeon]
MILEKLQKKLDLNWIKKNDAWDIVVYGSYARGEVNSRDIDLAIILSRAASVKKKMALCQELRRALSGKEYSLDVKAVDINDLMNVSFLAREAILAEGRSLLKKDYLAERFGFKNFAIIEYSLRNLTPAKQKMFYYALQGRKIGTGILARIGGRIISKGVFQAPTRHYEEVLNLLEQHRIIYKTTFVLQY